MLTKQDYGTPPELLSAIAQRWGEITWDLAARADNAVVPRGHYFGPGSRYAEDALAADWSICGRGLLFCNPPFEDSGAWARKARMEFGLHGVHVALLVPAAVDSLWFARFVEPYAFVHPLRPRVQFIGGEAGARSPTMLCHYLPGGRPGFAQWRWR